MRDLIVVSQNQRFINDIKHIASEYSFETHIMHEMDSLVDNPLEENYFKVGIIDGTLTSAKNELGGIIQVARMVFDMEFLILVVPKRVEQAIAEEVKKYGANYILLDSELETAKVDFILSQVIRCAFIPIKAEDLVVDTRLTFDIYHLIAHKGRFLPITAFFKDLTEKRLEKIRAVNEIYIHRRDLKAYGDYLAKNEGNEVRLARAKFLSLNDSYIELVQLLTDQGEFSSFEKGKKLLERCRQFCGELLFHLKQVKDPTLIINNSAIGDFGSVERSPAIACYAGVIGLDYGLNEEKTIDLMVCCLLSDIGLLTIPRGSAIKLKHDLKLNSEEFREYCRHPLVSVELALSRKLPLEERIREYIHQTHEQADAKGFPYQLVGDRLKFEPQLIRFLWGLDKASQIKLNTSRPDFQRIRRRFLKQAQDSKTFNSGFLISLEGAMKRAGLIHRETERDID